MKNNKIIKKENIHKILGFSVFIVISIKVFLSLTYLFRGNQYDYNDRISLLGIKEEVKNSIDAIYIGGSAAFVYWEPLKAYRDFGFTSYDLATNTIQAESILTYVKYAQKYQSPDLFIIGVRAFQYYDETGTEVGLRVSSDSLDVGIERCNLIKRYLSNRNLDTDELALYWDIVKYHTNHDVLKNPVSWGLMDNSMKSDYKGCQIQTSWCYLEKPENVKNNSRIKLLENDEKTLHELLDYLKKNSLKAIFVVCPYEITAEDYSKYNTIHDIVSKYGYEFLNTNDYWEEMGIDFSRDFYNNNHVNSLGAEKYTIFLGEYLKKNYHLPDHKGDEKYKSWQELSDSFTKIDNVSKKTIQDTISYTDEMAVISHDIRHSQNLTEWSSLVNDDRYTIVVAGDCSFTAESIDASSKKALDRIGVADVYSSANYIKIISGTKIIDFNSVKDNSITAKIGFVEKTVPCTVNISNGIASILINDINYSCSEKNSLNIVVFDNYHREIVDSIYLSHSKGRLEILRNE